MKMEVSTYSFPGGYNILYLYEGVWGFFSLKVI